MQPGRSRPAGKAPSNSFGLKIYEVTVVGLDEHGNPISGLEPMVVYEVRNASGKVVHQCPTFEEAAHYVREYIPSLGPG